MAGTEPKLLSVGGDDEWETWLAENSESTVEGVWRRRHRLQTASKPETRANRLAVIGMLERGEKP